MPSPVNTIERSLFKITAWLVGVTVLVVVLSILGHREFRNWQQRRLIATANALVNEGDYKRASLTARRVLQLNADNIEAHRTLGQIGERTGENMALDSYRRAVDLGGSQARDLLALARAALRLHDRTTAEQVMGTIPETARATADYHILAADLALSRRDPVEMERHLSEAVRLEPARKEYQVRLATLRLAKPDSPAGEQGRADLRALQTNPESGRAATNRLIEDALRGQDFAAAVEHAQRLDRFPDRTFADRISVLTVFQKAKHPEFAQFLAGLKSDAANDSGKVSAILHWLNANGMAADAIAWSQQLAPELMKQKLLPSLLADSYVAARDWTGLRAHLQKANWGELDFLRNALLARALRETGHELDAATAWNTAVKTINANAAALILLSENVEKWGWRKEAVDLLWEASKRPGKGAEAAQTLYEHLRRTGETANIYRALLRLEESRPGDASLQHQIAQLSLLLNMNAERGQKIARELFESEPGNALYATTHAFALHHQGQTKKTMQVMKGLREEQLRQPDVALYYGIFLAAAGEKARAEEFLELGGKVRLLPEERALWEKARRAPAP